MIREAISCDVCGAEKKVANHWFKVRETKAGLIFAPASSKVGEDVCGQVCAHRMLDEWLSSQVVPKVVANIEAFEYPEVARG